VHHLFGSGEMLGAILATAHNVRFLTKLAEEMRAAIVAGNFEIFRDNFLSRYTKAKAA
jgi:queuine tRNA-ribosyltransferase